MHDCFAIELTGECLKCFIRLTRGVPAVVVQSEALWARIQARSQGGFGGCGRTPLFLGPKKKIDGVRVWQLRVKVARNEVENALFAQRSAHRDSRIWRPELIEPAAERKRCARGRRPTLKLAYPDPQILPQCNISSNYPL